MRRDRQSEPVEQTSGFFFRYLLRKYTLGLTPKIKRGVERGVYADWRQIHRAFQLIFTSCFSFIPSIFQQMYLPAPPRRRDFCIFGRSRFLRGGGPAVGGSGLQVRPAGCPGGRMSLSRDGGGVSAGPALQLFLSAPFPCGQQPLGFFLS